MDRRHISKSDPSKSVKLPLKEKIHFRTDCVCTSVLYWHCYAGRTSHVGKDLLLHCRGHFPWGCGNRCSFFQGKISTFILLSIKNCHISERSLRLKEILQVFCPCWMKCCMKTGSREDSSNISRFQTGFSNWWHLIRCENTTSFHSSL